MHSRNITVPGLPPELAGHIARAQTLGGQDPGWAPPCGSLWSLLERRAIATPDREYLVYYGADGRRRAWTYKAFQDRVIRVAQHLGALGLGAGHRVATVLHNHVEAVFLYFATWMIGGCVVPINVEETAERMRFILDNAGVRAVFALPEFAGHVAGAGVPVALVPEHGQLPEGGGRLPPVEADRLHQDALIVYTSGTTGNPKGVVLTQYNLLADADAIAAFFRFCPGERWMCVLPVHHVNGIVVTMLTPLYGAGTWVLNRRFSTQHFWHRAATERVTTVSMVPTLLEFLLAADEDLTHHDLSHLRGVICGAGPLLVETADRFQERFFPIYHGYGLSESTAYACMTPLDMSPEERRAWYTHHGFPTIGVSMPHCDLAILGPGGGELPPGQRGEICLRGPIVMSGYYGRADANAGAFPGDGYFHSGDEGFWLPGAGGQPFFFITGRLKELIIRGGVNLSPLETDEALRTHPAVQFAMAVPFANRWYGEEVAAYVVPAEAVWADLEAAGAAGSDDRLQAEARLAKSIQAHVAGRLPFPQQPKVVLFGRDVPFTSTGKPKRIELARQLAPALAAHRDIQYREGGGQGAPGGPGGAAGAGAAGAGAGR